MIEKALTDFMFLFATIDPIGALVIFVALTERMTPAQRNMIALTAILYAAAVLVGALILGQIILSHMRVRMVSMQVAGGIILFIFALKMVFTSFDAHEGGEEEDDRNSIAVFPLAIPGIATPGAIMAVILITDNNVYGFHQQALTGIMLIVVLGITYLMMRASDKVLRFTGKNGASLLIKIMGMLLAALSVELVMSALGVERWLAPMKH